MIRAAALFCTMASLAALAPSYAAPATAAARLPPLMLWAWERPEDLRALGPDVGVAFLAQTVTLDGDRIHIRPRMQRLRVDGTTTLVAVTRIENSAVPAFPALLTDALAEAIARTASAPQVAGVQIDFDAAASQRALYRAVVERLRARLAPDVALSITALASWCVGDAWLAGLPIDEAVPMLFRMGPFNAPYALIAQAQRHWAGQAPSRRECGAAIGVSLDEPRVIEPSRRRVYVFNPRPWTERTVADARREARR
jgi:hypothetical protein